MKPEAEAISQTGSQNAATAPDATARRRRLHGGGPFNAVVWLCDEGGPAPWIEKDFSGAVWLVRNTIGRFLVAHEIRVLLRLEKTGAVPTGVRRISPFALREAAIPGFALRDTLCGAFKGNRPEEVSFSGVPLEMLRETPPPRFFDDWEAALRACHALKFVHLDLHNARNVMVTPGFHPVMIDWQSALPTALLPGPLRRFLERIDLAGLAKFRAKFHPEKTTPDEKRRLKRARFVRQHFWLPRIRIGKGRKP